MISNSGNLAIFTRRLDLTPLTSINVALGFAANSRSNESRIELGGVATITTSGLALCVECKSPSEEIKSLASAKFVTFVSKTDTSNPFSRSRRAIEVPMRPHPTIFTLLKVLINELFC